ncbi:MAG: hypothetical protein ACUVWP_05545 [bacterium]
MNKDEWVSYIEKLYGEYISYIKQLYLGTEDPVLDECTHWLLVRYNNELLWGHSAFVIPKDIEEHFMPDPLMISMIPPGDVYEYIFNSEGNLIEEKYSGEKISEVVPFIKVDWHYMAMPYFFPQFEEPTYDLRFFSPSAFNLYYIDRKGELTPRWFSYLPASTCVSDYLETDDGVWLTDMANALVLYFSKEGRIFWGLTPFALPLRICTDGEGSVWVSDPLCLEGSTF